MRRLAPTPAGLAEATRQLASGGLVALPTETVYGLGADALDAAAVARIFEAKQRPFFDPLIVHVADPPSVGADPLGVLAEPAAAALAAAFWPGPLTLVVSRPAWVPAIVSSGLETLGVRVPDHAATRAVIRGLARDGRPGAVAAPSANPFGGVSPTRAEHVTVPCEAVLDGGPCTTGVESTVVRVGAAGAVVLRWGGLPAEAIGAALRAAGLPAGVEEAAPGGPLASPGRLERHYAPGTPLAFVEPGKPLPPAQPRMALLFCGDMPRGAGGWAAAENLSATGDLVEAAAGLFAAMRRLDDGGFEAVVARGVPAEGLGRAINDRLRRAATPGALGG